MKKIDLRIINKVLRGLLAGTYVLQAVPTGRKPKKIVEKPGKKARRGRPPGKVKIRRKPGRKAMSPSVKKRLLLKEKAVKIKQAKKSLPNAKRIFSFLDGKLDGIKLTALAKNFGVKRTILKPMILRLIKNGDLNEDKGVLYLKRRIRKKKGKKAPKPIPITPAVVENYLRNKGAATMAKITKDLKEKNYQRLIKVINVLKKEKKVDVENKIYHWIGSD